MLGVRHVHIADNIDDATVGLFRQALVFTAVTCLHVEDGDMQALGTYHAQTGVGIAQHQDGIGLGLDHHLITLVDDVTHRSPEVIAYRLHIDVGVSEFEVLEENTVEVVVVVLTGMRQQTVEILPTLIDHCCQPDNLRACTHDDEQLQFAVMFKLFIIHNDSFPDYD